MTGGFLVRILRESGVPDLLEVLAKRLNPTDLQSLLIEAYKRSAANQTPAGLLDTYERNRFVRPSLTSPQAFVEIDRLAFSLAAPPFEPIELSPVCPLGTNAVVAPISQNVAIATIRNTEVVSDSTNVLAIECAVWRRKHLRSRVLGREWVRLGASHRVVRAQKYDRPDLIPHFRIFALCTAGPAEGDYRFETEALSEQLSFYLRFMAALQEIGYSLSDLRIAITDLAGEIFHEKVRADVIAPLSIKFPDARLAFNPERTSDRGYYDRLCFHIYARDPRGLERERVDGGFTTWTQELLSNRKERLLISGIGTERICQIFRES